MADVWTPQIVSQTYELYGDGQELRSKDVGAISNKTLSNKLVLCASNMHHVGTHYKTQDMFIENYSNEVW